MKARAVSSRTIPGNRTIRISSTGAAVVARGRKIKPRVVRAANRLAARTSAGPAVRTANESRSPMRPMCAGLFFHDSQGASRPSGAVPR